MLFAVTLSYHNIIYIWLKSDITNNSKHQHRVTELDGQGSKGALTAAYRDKNGTKYINSVNDSIR